MSVVKSLKSGNNFIKLVIAITLLLLLLHILAMISSFAFGHDYVKGLVPFFNFEHEFNAPTIWSVILFLISSFLLQKMSSVDLNKGDPRYWTGLSIIFLILASDELFQFHERLNRPVRVILDTGGLLYYAWVLPVLLIVLIISLVYLRFYFRLPLRTKNLFLLSFSLFMFGAVVLEMMEGRINEAGGYQSLNYMILVTFEESAEMLALCIFIYALLDYRQKWGSSSLVKM